MHPHEHVRATLRRGLVGGGRFTVVREPRSALSVALWPYSQVLHAFAISDRIFARDFAEFEKHGFDA